MKKTLKMLALVMALVMVFGCMGAVAFAAEAKEGGSALNFTTGGDQGTYYGFGGVMAQKIGEVTSTSVTAITSGGSHASVTSHPAS